MTTGTRRKPSEYDFKKQLFDELLLPTSGAGRRSTFPRGGTVKHIDIHHMTIHDSKDGAACRACVETWKNRQASAHYGVDRDYVAQFVYDNRMAWGDANGQANREGIIVEHANSTLEPTWEIAPETLNTSAKLVAGLHLTHKLGRPTSHGFGDGGTIRTHQSFYATSCPGPYFKKIWSKYVALVQAEYDHMVQTGPIIPTNPNAPVTKVNLLHWNIAGSDDVNGYGATNGTRGDNVGRYAKKLGFDVFLTCESSQSNLRKGINLILGKFHPYQSHSKTIWYDDGRVTNIKARKTYSADGFSYLNTRKWGMAFFGKRNGKKFSVLEIHTDYRKPAKQAKQVQAIFKKWRTDCDKLGIKHVNQFVCGDFNPDETSGDNPFKALSAWNFEEKGSRTVATFLDGSHKDGILAHKEAIVEVVVKPRDDGNMRLSDHHPIKFIPTLQ